LGFVDGTCGGVLLMKQLLFGHDEEIARWTADTFRIPNGRCDMAIGIVEDGVLKGSIMWHAYRGHDIEISYYGPRTMTLGIARTCAKIAMDHFGVSRVTARTARSNKTMTRSVKKIGFEYEGISHHGYGEQDAVMFGLYGKNLARLAGKELQ
jgi:RimJ/RimL family protein N-acetyltransferase